jgi:hypothetical protein
VYRIKALKGGQGSRKGSRTIIIIVVIIIKIIKDGEERYTENI